MIVYMEDLYEIASEDLYTDNEDDDLYLGDEDDYPYGGLDCE
jgi:hypothetical protein